MDINRLFNIDGKTALITGGSRGIGEMIAAGFLANGVKVYITARKEAPLLEDQLSNTTKFEWPNSYWFIAERTNGRLAMIGFMAVIINYTLFGWIAYPIL